MRVIRNSECCFARCYAGFRYQQKYSQANLHSRPLEKDGPEVFDLRKHKYKPRTGVQAVTTLIASAKHHSVTLQLLFDSDHHVLLPVIAMSAVGLVAYACLLVDIRYMWCACATIVCQLWPVDQVFSKGGIKI